MIPPIFKSIQEKLQEEPKIKYISEDWGQLNYYDSACPVQWPCVLFDINQGTFSNIGHTKQEGSLSITVTVAHLRLTPNSARASTKQIEHSWEVGHLVEGVHQLLQGFRPVEQHGKLIRTSMRKTKRADSIKQYEITYTLGVHEV